MDRVGEFRMNTVARRALATAATFIVLGTAAASAASSCVAGKDEMALQTRLLQTELMVSALTCKQTTKYNDFVKMHQKELMKAHTQLRSFFNKKYGAKVGGDELNSFITRLANDSSKRSIKNVKLFCETTTVVYDGALASPSAHFGEFAALQPVSQLHGFVPCGPATQEAKAGAKEIAKAMKTASAGDIPTPRRKPAILASVGPDAAAGDAAKPAEPPRLIAR